MNTIERIITPRSIFGAVSSAGYIITKIAFVEIALLWLIVDYLRLSMTGAVLAGVVVSIPCLWASVKVSIMAFEAETDPENNEY